MSSAYGSSPSQQGASSTSAKHLSVDEYLSEYMHLSIIMLFYNDLAVL